MSLPDLLLRAARALDRLATQIEGDVATPEKSSASTAARRVAGAERASAPAGFGQHTREQVQAFRANFSTGCLLRLDAACAAAGIERHAGWAAFMDAWTNSGGRSLGARLEGEPGREVYRLAGRDGTGSLGTVTLVREGAKGWVMDDITDGPTSFTQTVERLAQRRRD